MAATSRRLPGGITDVTCARSLPGAWTSSRSSAGKHVVFLSWRDTRNPEGGGAERYLEKMAAGLVARGCRVTIFCAAHAAAPAGRGRRRRPVRAPRLQALGLPRRACAALRRGDLGRPDVVVDVQNGLPFFTRLVDPRAGRRAGPPRAPRAVAGRLPRADRPGRLVDRAPAGAPALPPQPVRRGLARHPRRAARPRRHRAPDRGRAQRHRPGASPVDDRASRRPRWSRGRPAGPAQAGRARHRRGRRAARDAPGPAAARRGQRLVGGPSCTSTPRARAPATPSSSRDTSTRSASTRSTSSPGCWRCRRSRRAGGWWSARPAMHGTPTVAYRERRRHPGVDRRRASPGVLVDDQAGFTAAIGDAAGRPRRTASGWADGAREMSHAFTWEHAQRSFALVVLAALAARGGRAGPRARTRPPRTRPGASRRAREAGQSERSVVRAVVEGGCVDAGRRRAPAVASASRRRRRP